MHLLVVASTFPAHDADPVPAFVRDQVLALRAEDPSLRVTVLAPHDRRSATRTFTEHADYDEHRFHYAWPRGAEQLAGRGIMPTLQAKPWLLPTVLTLFVGEFLALWSLVRRERPDVIYAHWFTPQAVVARWVGRLTGTPFVFTTHASDVSVWWKIPWIGPRVVRSHAVRARRITAVSRRSMDKLRAFFDDAAWAALEPRTRIIPMGVDLPEAEEPSVGPGERVLFVGRLAEKKGVAYLLEAVAEVRRTRPHVTLTVTGDGPLRADLEQRAAELGLGPDAVRFTGYLTGADKAALFTDHGTYVVPSIITDSGDAEGLPVALMEGLAVGQVCIATAESGADDFLVDGQNGYLVGERDSAALAGALAAAVDLDDARRARMGHEAMRTARQFHWPTVARAHLDFLFADEGV